MPLCNIHTVSIVSQKEIVLPPELGNNWIEVQHRLNTKTNRHIYIAKINTHKWRDELTFSYGKFQSDLLEIIQAMGLEEYSFSRVDFAFNFLDDNYDELHKLNKCICLLIGVANNLINRYESKDPLTLDNLTIRLANLSCDVNNLWLDTLSLSEYPLIINAKDKYEGRKILVIVKTNDLTDKEIEDLIKSISITISARNIEWLPIYASSNTIYFK